MGNRYCKNCGMPVPGQESICPECGYSLEESAPEIVPQQIVPRISLKKQDQVPAGTEDMQQSGQRKSKKTALFVVGGSVIMLCALFFILDIPGEIRKAASRHREEMMSEERTGTAERPDLNIPEMPAISQISIPEVSVSIPNIQFPKPPEAEFSMESYSVKTNQNGETVLDVTVNYTNKAEEEEYYLTNFTVVVKQDDEACKYASSVPENETHMTAKVLPDETILVSQDFVITPEKETTVSVIAFFGEDAYLQETILPHADGTVSVCE